MMLPADLAAASDLGFLAGGGEIGAIMRSKDWSSTSLGPPETWPQSLRTSVSTCLNCSFPILIWWGRDLVKIYNDAYAEILAQKHPQALGTPGHQVWPEIWDTIGPMLARVLDQGEAAPAEDMELWLERRGYPEECYFSFSYSPIRDETGEIVGVFCPVVETTLRVFSERRAHFLLKLETALRNVSEAGQVKHTACRILGEHLGAAQVGYAEVLPGGESVLIEDDWNDGRMSSNAGVHKLDDYGPTAMGALAAGQTVSIGDVEQDPRTCDPIVLDAYRARRIRAYVDAPLMREGALTSILFLHSAEPRAWTEQEVGYVQIVAERTWSAVERARAETALRQSEDEFRTLANNLPSLCWMAGPDGQIYWFNRRYSDFSGKTHEELVAGAWRDLHDPTQYPEVMDRWARSVATGAPFEMVYALRSHNGDVRPFLTRVVPLRSASGVITKWFGTNVDISEQRRTEERLRANENELRLLNETLEQKVAERTVDRDRIWRLSTDIMLVARFDGTVMAANPAWTSILGWQERELLEATFLDFVHPDDLDPTMSAMQVLAAGETVNRFENRYRRHDGGYRWLSWTAVPDDQFIHAVGRDVTSEKEAAALLEATQERLRQSQRMEALGQLAGGIAHDFNNVLQAVTGGLNVIKRRSGDATSVRQIAEMTLGAANRGAAVTGRLLAFARKDELAAVAVPVGELLEGLREILFHTLEKSVVIKTEWDPAIPPLHADRAQLETVIINLAVNARDAMPNGGALTLSGAAYSAGENDDFGMAPGGYIRLMITDSGAGMDAATLARACEPFFTTKPLGQGTGLGLAMARGFAQQSGGAFEISSILGEGTAVTLWFPQSPAIVPTRSDEPSMDSCQSGETSARVLLVDDEPLVRGVLAEQLEDAGYIVIPATDGLDALSRLDAGATPDLLVSDYAMPGMNGMVLVREARRRLPHLPVLLLTGYADPALRSELESEGGVALLMRKPIANADLISSARTLIERAALQVVKSS